MIFDPNQWEKEFAKKLNQKTEKVDTSLLWQNVKSHVPENEKSRSNPWLLFWAFGASLFALVAGAISLSQNQLLQKREYVISQLQNELVKCNKLQTTMHQQIENKAEPGKSTALTKGLEMNQIQGEVLSANMKKRIADPGHLIYNSDIFLSQPTAQAQTQEISPPASIRGHIILDPIDKRWMGISQPARLSISLADWASTKKLNSKKSLKNKNQWEVILQGGPSFGSAFRKTDVEQFDWKAMYNLGISINWQKALNDRLSLGLRMNYHRNESILKYQYDTNTRVEITDINEIFIDPQGNISSNTGPLGATEYTTLKANLFQSDHAVFCGPDIRYDLLKNDQVKLTISASLLLPIWLQTNGAGPLGNIPLPIPSTDALIDLFRKPSMAIHLLSHKSISKNNDFVFGIGLTRDQSVHQFYSFDFKRTWFNMVVNAGFRKRM